MLLSFLFSYKPKSLNISRITVIVIRRIFRPPKLEQDFGTLTDSDKEREMEIYRRRQVHYFYVGFTNHMNKAHFHAIGKYNLVLRN
jgi:hypothetical protein